MPAGEYTGSAILSMNGRLSNFPVKIRIYDVQMPEQVHAESSFLIWYDHIAAGEGTTDAAMEDAYYSYLVEKRIMPYSPGPAITNNVSTYVDYMVENLASNGKISSYALPYRKDNTSDTAKLDAAYVTEVLKAMVEKNIALRQAGDDSIDLFEKAYFYLGSICDEPREENNDPADEALVLECDQIIADAKAALAPMLDAYPDLQKSFLGINHIVTTNYYKAIDGGEHTYCPQFQYFGTTALRAHYAGEEVWWYGCLSPQTPYPTYHLNDELITSRVLSWMQYDYNVSGTLYWCVNYYYEIAEDGNMVPRDVWNHPSPIEGYAGDGYLLYPGADYGVYGPIGTMRLESIREGNEDYEYFWMFQQKIQEYNEAHGTTYDANNLLNTYFSGLYWGMYANTSSARFAQQRVRLLGILEQMYDDLDAAVASLIG